jgi:hypothetical protein
LELEEMELEMSIVVNMLVPCSYPATGVRLRVSYVAA